MKFIYNGDLPLKDVDLVLGGVFKPNEIIVKGTIFEVPDDNKKLLQRVKLSGVYVPYTAPRKVKPKKANKKEEKKVKEED